MLFDPFDVALKVDNALLNGRNVSSKGLALSDAARLNDCDIVAGACKLCLQLAQIIDILLLELLVLYLDDFQVVLV